MTGRRLSLAMACAVAVLAGVLAERASSRPMPAVRVGIFYYPWWGSEKADGAWIHWGQNDHLPPSDVASSFYPSRGAYSSADPAVVRAHMREIASAGVDTVIVSWWGDGSVEDARLPLVLREAKAARLRVAVHVEPWRGRSPQAAAAAIASLQARGVREFFVYDSTADDDRQWAEALRTVDRAVVYASTSLVGKARRGGFDGVYSYDVFAHSGASFGRVCAQARQAGLLCAPSVGPGYDARRATGDGRVQPRARGARYDLMWSRAIRAHPDMVTVTSYNEWHEGTQIEPARAAGEPYRSYEGAYGMRGPAAERAYLDRTAHWVAQLRASSAS
jgi:hypothetical protein